MKPVFSASLYIHVPFCLQRCSYCDFFSVKKSGYSKLFGGFKPFVSKILEDICFLKNRYEIGFWETVYAGGGTPSLLSPEDIFLLAKNISSSQGYPVKEFTVEANPEDINSEWLSAAAEGGVNRLSVGVQSLSDEVLKAEKRRGSAKKTIDSLNLISSVWKGNFSLDFIAGLKKQTVQSLIDSLKQCLEYKPQHISLYEIMSLKPLSPEDKDFASDIWEKGAEYLKMNSFEQYEISNFSYKGLYNSIHNINYWDMKTYAGAGPGAVGSVFFEDAAPFFAERFSGLKNIKAWFDAEDRKDAYGWEKIGFNELVEETVMMGFRLKRGLDRKLFRKRFGCDVLSFIPKTAERWHDKTLLDMNENFVFLTGKGILFLNRFLIECFTEMNF